MIVAPAPAHIPSAQLAAVDQLASLPPPVQVLQRIGGQLVRVEADQRRRAAGGKEVVAQASRGIEGAGGQGHAAIVAEDLDD